MARLRIGLAGALLLAGCAGGPAATSAPVDELYGAGRERTDGRPRARRRCQPRGVVEHHPRACRRRPGLPRSTRPYIEELQLAALTEPSDDEPRALTRYRDLLVELIAENDIALPAYDNFLFSDSYAEGAATGPLGSLPLIRGHGGARLDRRVRGRPGRAGDRRDPDGRSARRTPSPRRPVSTRTDESGHEIPRGHPQVVTDAVLDLLNELG